MKKLPVGKSARRVCDEGRRFKDHATGETGDVVDFVAKGRGWSTKEALDWIWERVLHVREVVKKMEP